MNRETADKLRGLDRSESLPDKIARLKDQADKASPVLLDSIAEPTLPSGLTVPLVTMTTDELHDLVYNAAATYLHRLTSMPKDRARLHASRIAIEAQLIARDQDYTHRGVDPRG